MRNNRKNPDTADRQGPLASLMRAAEPLDQLTAAERERIKLRLRGEMALHRTGARMRLLTAMAGVGLLLAGGAALAGRLGLVRWPSVAGSPVPEKTEIAPAQRKPRGPTRAAVAAAPAAIDGKASAQEPAPVPSVPASTPIQAAGKTVHGETRSSAPVQTRQAETKSSASVQTRQAATFKPAQPAAPIRETPAHGPAPAALAPPILASPVPAPVAPSGPALAMVTPADSRTRPGKAIPTSAAPPNAQDLLGQAMRSLRRQHDPAAALAILARHAGLFPDSSLAGERTQLEVEALLALGRYPEALTRLDGMDLRAIPRAAERHVVRGELRAQARRWNDATTDFDQALSQVKAGSPWHERALWGRALARGNGGDGLGSRADMRLYLQIYPQGRFSPQAARLLTDQP